MTILRSIQLPHIICKKKLDVNRTIGFQSILDQIDHPRHKEESRKLLTQIRSATVGINGFLMLRHENGRLFIDIHNDEKQDFSNHESVNGYNCLELLRVCFKSSYYSAYQLRLYSGKYDKQKPDGLYQEPINTDDRFVDHVHAHQVHSWIVEAEKDSQNRDTQFTECYEEFIEPQLCNKIGEGSEGICYLLDNPNERLVYKKLKKPSSCQFNEYDTLDCSKTSEISASYYKASESFMVKPTHFIIAVQSKTKNRIFKVKTSNTDGHDLVRHWIEDQHLKYPRAKINIHGIIMPYVKGPCFLQCISTQDLKFNFFTRVIIFRYILQNVLQLIKRNFSFTDVNVQNFLYVVSTCKLYMIDSGRIYKQKLCNQDNPYKVESMRIREILNIIMPTLYMILPLCNKPYNLVTEVQIFNKIKDIIHDIDHEWDKLLLKEEELNSLNHICYIIDHKNYLIEFQNKLVIILTLLNSINIPSELVATMQPTFSPATDPIVTSEDTRVKLNTRREISVSVELPKDDIQSARLNSLENRQDGQVKKTTPVHSISEHPRTCILDQFTCDTGGKILLIFLTVITFGIVWIIIGVNYACYRKQHS